MAGCSSTDMLNVPQDDHAELQVWVRQPPGSGPAKTADRLVKAFVARTGFRARAVALYEDFETKLQQQAAYRQLPDVVINDTAQLGTMQTQGWLQQIDRTTFPGADQVTDRAWRAAQAADGNYYAVPMTAHTFALFVRADWRARLNLPPPRSCAEVQPGRWVPAINDQKSVRAATWLKSMFCQYHVVNPDAVQIDTPRAHDTFEKNLGGIYLTGPYMLPRFVKSMGSAKLEVFPLPAAPGASPSALAEGENVYLTMGSHNRAGQKAFAQFATSVEGQTIAMDGDNNGPIVRLPVNTRVDLAAVRSDPRWKTFQQVYNTAKYTPNVPNWAPFRQLAADVLNGVMADCGSDVKASLDRLAAQFSDELKRQNVYGG